MKKRILCFFLGVLMSFALFACDNGDDPNDEGGDPPFSEITDPNEGIPTPIVPI